MYMSNDSTFYTYISRQMRSITEVLHDHLDIIFDKFLKQQKRSPQEFEEEFKEEFSAILASWRQRSTSLSIIRNRLQLQEQPSPNSKGQGNHIYQVSAQKVLRRHPSNMGRPNAARGQLALESKRNGSKPQRQPKRFVQVFNSPSELAVQRQEINRLSPIVYKKLGEKFNPTNSGASPKPQASFSQCFNKYSIIREDTAEKPQPTKITRRLKTPPLVSPNTIEALKKVNLSKPKKNK